MAIFCANDDDDDDTTDYFTPCACARGNDTCGESTTMEMQENLYEIMKNLTNLDEEIALPPEKLCLCNDNANELNCTSVLNLILPLQKELAPGQIAIQNFDVSM